MRTTALILRLAGAALLLATAACTSAPRTARAAAEPVRLQVAVVVPPSMHTIRDDDVAYAFGQTVCNSLHAHGFKGRIKLLDETDAPMPGVPLLQVNLTEWRVDGIGNVSCTFGATLNTPAGSKGLGMFRGYSFLSWARHDVYMTSEGAQDAAHDALDDLADRLRQSGLITLAPVA